MDPKMVREGRDPQLERAVAVAMEQMKTNPVPQPNRPPYPNYQRPIAAPTRTSGGAGQK
jgi:tricorn protease